jgi:hypothetical protein
MARRQRPRGAQLAIGAGTVLLASPRVGQWEDEAELRALRTGEVTHGVNVHVDDVDRRYAHTKR